MSVLLRWPTEDPRVALSGRLVIDTEPFHHAYVTLDIGGVATHWQIRERAQAGAQVILRGHFWELA